MSTTPSSTSGSDEIKEPKTMREVVKIALPRIKGIKPPRATAKAAPLKSPMRMIPKRPGGTR